MMISDVFAIQQTLIPSSWTWTKEGMQIFAVALNSYDKHFHGFGSNFQTLRHFFVIVG